MHFFLDENFPLSVLPIIESLGHSAIRALDIFDQGSSDEELFTYAINNKAIFLTTDKDFYHTIPMKCNVRGAKIIVIAISKPNSKNIIDRLLNFLHTIDLERMSEGIFLINDRKILKRHVNG